MQLLHSHLKQTRVIQANYLQTADYQTVVKELNQPDVILAIARDLTMVHQHHAELLRNPPSEALLTSLTMYQRAFREECITALESSSGPVPDKEILLDLARTVYAKDNKPLPEGLPDFLQRHETALIKDLDITSINAKAAQMKNPDFVCIDIRKPTGFKFK